MARAHVGGKPGLNYVGPCRSYQKTTRSLKSINRSDNTISILTIYLFQDHSEELRINWKGTKVGTVKNIPYEILCSHQKK